MSKEELIQFEGLVIEILRRVQGSFSGCRDGGSYAGRLQSSGWSWKGFAGKIFLFYRILGPTPDVIAQEYAVSGKAMELLKEIVPRVTRVAVPHR
jgi:hypothetical protein